MSIDIRKDMLDNREREVMQMPRFMVGPKSQYRGKDRSRPFSFALTPEGRRFLEEDARRLNKSMADHLEHLVRKEHTRLERSGAASAADATM